MKFWERVVCNEYVQYAAFNRKSQQHNFQVGYDQPNSCSSQKKMLLLCSARNNRHQHKLKAGKNACVSHLIHNCSCNIMGRAILGLSHGLSHGSPCLTALIWTSSHPSDMSIGSLMMTPTTSASLHCI